MKPAYANINEQQAETAFTGQSVVFDHTYGHDTIINYKRSRVRSHVLQYLPPNSTILELNSGTGEDALFFAGLGHRVHATDISAGMQRRLKSKSAACGMEQMITTETISFTQLSQLSKRGPYDLIFSNFAGLNCTGELAKVLASFNGLLNPDGMVTLVVLPKFCLWETLLLFKGKFRTAFRRFFSSRGRRAHINGEYFKCWYYNPSFIIKELQGRFAVLKIEGLCTIVLPSYIGGFAEKHPTAYQFLKSWEDRLGSAWPWRCIGDYYIISLKKK